VLDGAANDPAQDVRATEVARLDAFGGQKDHSPPVIGEHTIGLGRRFRIVVARTRSPGDPAQDLLEAFDLEDRVDVLQDDGAALQAKPGVDVLARQRCHAPVGVLLELHEDEVPELEEAVAGAAGRTVRLAAAALGAAVVVDLRAGAAGARRAGLPEVVFAQARDPLGRDADSLPGGDGDLVGAQRELRIAAIDGRPELGLVELHLTCHELPGQIDRAVLEVVAEREVTEHLEEGEMARRGADLVDVGGAKALLHRGQARARRLLQPEEEGLERLHPGGRQQHRRVVRLGHERARGPQDVTLALKVGEVALPQLSGRAHAEIVCVQAYPRGSGAAKGSWAAGTPGAATRRSTRPRVPGRSRCAPSPERA